LGIGLEFVGDSFVSSRSSLAVCKRLDVNEDLVPAIVRGDEAKTLFIFPSGYFSLMAHADPSQG
jgi:hypothetical protein